jgi:hypothetical protein
MYTPMILQSFSFIAKKNEDVGVDLPPRILKSNEWMARWLEQEDGAMRNFSIIELAQEKVKKEGGGGFLLYL